MSYRKLSTLIKLARTAGKTLKTVKDLKVFSEYIKIK